jgi:probable sporulation protein (polysaccharide deacetylase family)
VDSVKQYGRAMDAYSDRADNLEDELVDPLLARIRQEAEKQRIKPVDAAVDRVWKAIPGYNGLEVDIERSYEAMVGQPADAPLKLVYRELKPKVSLDDLGAHPIYRGNPNKPMAALMINVAWGNEYIGPMLDTLDKEEVKATFFLDGTWLRNNPDLAKLIASRGHEMSNHAYSHPDMAALGRSQQYQQIERTETLLRSTLDVHNRWFAPPSGSYNATTVKTAYELGLKTVLWTVDTVDWKRPPAEQIVSKIARSVAPGSLVLMHPTVSSRDALSGMIAAIRSKGLMLGTVSETLSEDRIRTTR